MGIISDSHDFAFFWCLSNFIYWYTEACFINFNIKLSWLWDDKVWVSWRRIIFTFVAFALTLGNNWVCTVISSDCENIQMREDRWHGVYMQMCCRCLHLIIERWHVQKLTPVDFYILKPESQPAATGYFLTAICQKHRLCFSSVALGVSINLHSPSTFFFSVCAFKDRA